jgi:hypothetical protein
MIKTIKNLITFGSFALIFTVTSVVSAYVPGVWDPSPRLETNPAFTTVVSMNVDNTQLTTKEIPEKVTPKQEEPVKKTTTPSTVKKIATEKSVTKTEKTDTTKVSDDNNLTALSFKGNGGFMPSSVWQWILVVLLILAIIILARMIAKPASNKPALAH